MCLFNIRRFLPILHHLYNSVLFGENCVRNSLHANYLRNCVTNTNTYIDVIVPASLSTCPTRPIHLSYSSYIHLSYPRLVPRSAAPRIWPDSLDHHVELHARRMQAPATPLTLPIAASAHCTLYTTHCCYSRYTTTPRTQSVRVGNWLPSAHRGLRLHLRSACNCAI